MTAEEKAYEVMSAAAPLTALVPAAKIRVPGAWQNLTGDYIIHFPVTMEPVATFDKINGAGLRAFEFYQVSVYSETYSRGRTIAGLVIANLGGKHGKFYFRATGGAIYLGRDDRAELEHFAANFAVHGHED